MTTTMLMHWVWPVVIGFAAGAIAKVIFVGIIRSGFWVTSIVGVVGAVAAAYVGQRIGWYREGHMVAEYIAAVLGAVALLVLFQLFTSRQ